MHNMDNPIWHGINALAVYKIKSVGRVVYWPAIQSSNNLRIYVEDRDEFVEFDPIVFAKRIEPETDPHKARFAVRMAIIRKNLAERRNRILNGDFFDEEDYETEEDNIEHESSTNEIIKDLLDDNDAYSRSESEGWFYADTEEDNQFSNEHKTEQDVSTTERMHHDEDEDEDSEPAKAVFIIDDPNAELLNQFIDEEVSAMQEELSRTNTSLLHEIILEADEVKRVAEMLIKKAERLTKIAKSIK